MNLNTQLKYIIYRIKYIFKIDHIFYPGSYKLYRFNRLYYVFPESYKIQK